MTRRLYTTQEAAQILGIKPDLISKWRHRRKVTPASMLRGRGRGAQVPLYDLEDLRPLAEAYLDRARHAESDPR